MSKRRWSCFLLSVFFTTTSVACGVVNKPAVTEPAPPLVTTASLVPDPTLTITSPPQSTDTPAPAPSPTFDFATTWQVIPDAVPGWQIAMPPEWVNVTARLETAATTTPYGLITMLATDSERTAASLLASKPLHDGAFVVGLLIDTELTTDIPQANLEQLLVQMETAVPPLTPIVNTRLATTSPATQSASVDIAGHLLPFFATPDSQLHTQIVYLIPPTVAPAKPEQILFLFSAPDDQWGDFADTFSRIMATFMPRTNATARTTTHIQGELTAGESVTSNLQKGQQDLWMLFVNEPQYLSLRLEPEGDQLDLAAAIIDPMGRVLANLDNGYTNNSERVVDLFLPENGRYLIAVSEFDKQAGSYHLEINTNTTPAFNGHGDILLNETIQSQLPAETRHLWTFEGTAGQNISVVLKPLQHTLDAILNVYGPDGTRLAALDEGFSGDPEVISGLSLPLTGAYTIVVSSFGSAGEAYALSLNRGGEQTANFYDAGDLVYGQSRRETLRANEAHAWFFQAQSGDEVQIKATPLGDNLDLDIWLVDPDINLLATADLFLGGEAEMLEETLPATGQYLVLVREFSGQPGSYEIGLMAMPGAPPAYAGTVAYSNAVSGTLSSGQSAFWLFMGHDEDTIDIHLQPAANNDLVLILQTPDGHTALTVDNAAVGEAESIDNFRLTTDGEWRVLIEEFFGDAGAYELVINQQ
ncbi:MAG: hypothetical protein R3E31_06415 [Chloroflexota bacterium]